jgi:hypothetical protein
MNCQPLLLLVDAKLSRFQAEPDGPDSARAFFYRFLLLDDMKQSLKVRLTQPLSALTQLPKHWRNV